MQQIGNHTNIEIETPLLRHMILNTLRSIRQKFKNEYGEMVIACDDKHYWRRDVFPYYKANRKKSREKSELDWNAIFESIHQIRDEIKENFPYRVIQVDRAEADDVIGALTAEFGNTSEKIMIVSADKDFKQLQSYFNVRQYDPIRKKLLEEKNPERFLKEHIIRGDTGDGVVNILSDDDSLVVGKRQKSIMQKKLDVWLDQPVEEFCDTAQMLRNYHRNKELIDLSMIPEDIKTKVVEEYHSQLGKGREKLFNYFVQHKLKNLLESIGEF